MDTPIYKPDIPAPLALGIRLTVAGFNLSLVLYGITILIFARCIQAHIRRLRAHRGHNLSQKLQIAHACTIFSLGTIFIANNAWIISVATLDYPLYPGGPDGWIMTNYSVPPAILGNTCFVVTAWLADAFMLFRCYVVYNQTGRWVWFVILLPCLLYLTSIISGVILLAQVSLPSSSLYNHINWGLTNFSIAASLNVVITILISGRLIAHRFRMEKIMEGRHSSLNMYTSISTILVESSALYAAFFLMFVVPYSMSNFVAQFFLPLLAQVQVISPLLVSLRLAQQIAWTKDTTTNDVSAVVFGKNTGGSTTILSRHDLELSEQSRKRYPIASEQQSSMVDDKP